MATKLGSAFKNTLVCQICIWLKKNQKEKSFMPTGWSMSQSTGCHLNHFRKRFNFTRHDENKCLKRLSTQSELIIWLTFSFASVLSASVQQSNTDVGTTLLLACCTCPYTQFIKTICSWALIALRDSDQLACSVFGVTCALMRLVWDYAMLVCG